MSGTRSGALWQPFTPAGGPRSRLLVSGDGKFVTDADGNRLLDATAGGVACVIVGHGRAEIAEAVRSQLETLEYYCLFGYSHPMAETFAAEIAARTPGDLDHVFFTNSGSEAVETALKIARGYWQRVGSANKTKFISLRNSYHGMNFGGISVGGLTENRTAFGPLLSGCSQVAAHDLDALAEELSFQDPTSVAAVIMEPVQAAGGVYPPPEEYLAGVRKLCSDNEVLLILDEVVCGWGRLGHWFGGHRYDVVADIMTTAKGLTSAYIPMGAAIASERVHEAFVAKDSGIELMHGYTYSGHPAACAAGLAVIGIIEREGLVQNANKVGRHLQARVAELATSGLVTDVRGEGMLAAVELGGDNPIALVAEVASRIQDNGVLVRAQEDHLGIYPPLTFDVADVDRVVDVTADALESARVSR
jgi:beta-alanine--pyruvate transaminase